MKTKRIELNWDPNSTQEVGIIDHIKGEVLLYPENAKVIHERFGGATYYTSWSGKTGAGYINKNLAGMSLTRGLYSQSNGHAIERILPTGFTISALGGDTDPKYGKFALIGDITFEGESGKLLAFFSNFFDGLNQALKLAESIKDSGRPGNIEEFLQEDGGKMKKIRYKYLIQDGDGWAPITYNLFVLNHETGKGYDYVRLAGLVGNVFPDEISDIHSEFYIGYVSGRGAGYVQTDEHWNVVRYWNTDPLVDRAERENLIEKAGWTIIPQSALVDAGISQEDQQSMTLYAHSRYGYDTSVYAMAVAPEGWTLPSYEYEVCSSNKVEAFRPETYRRAVEGVKNKMALDAPDEKREDLISGLPEDLAIYAADSHAAGNCEAGTEEFRKKFFDNRDSATVGELRRLLPKVRQYKGALESVLLYVARREAKGV